MRPCWLYLKLQNVNTTLQKCACSLLQKNSGQSQKKKTKFRASSTSEWRRSSLLISWAKRPCQRKKNTRRDVELPISTQNKKVSYRLSPQIEQQGREASLLLGTCNGDSDGEVSASGKSTFSDDEVAGYTSSMILTPSRGNQSPVPVVHTPMIYNVNSTQQVKILLAE